MLMGLLISGNECRFHKSLNMPYKNKTEEVMLPKVNQIPEYMMKEVRAAG